MDDFESLELLSLVSKVTTELQNHLGLADKDLAEFVIAQHGGKDLAAFKKALVDMDADFPNSLVESIDRLVLTMHPKLKKQVTSSTSTHNDTDRFDEVGRKARVFKGLAVADKEQTWEDMALQTIPLCCSKD